MNTQTSPPARAGFAQAVPVPAGAEPVSGTTGACRHDKGIVPVLDGQGELVRWICAKWPRCDAKFDKSVAVYDPADLPAEGEPS